MKITYTLSEKALAPVGVGAFLRNNCGFSHGLWRRLKWNGTLLVNGQKVRASTATARPGDEITCIIPEQASLAITPMTLDIRYEDDYLMVLNKPAGILVHPTGGDHDHTLGNGILWHYRQTGQELDFHPVHRLDRNTTGLLLIAKLPQLQNVLTQQNGDRFFHRSYLAIIKGSLKKPSGTINLPIARHPESIIQRICTEDGKRAVTHYRTLAQRNGLSLLEMQLETGRTHQIRVHLSALGHPLLGDDLYGGDTRLIGRQALHAYHLEATNPLDGTQISIYQDLPADMQKLFWGR